jgi:hypothetical protein
MMCVQNGCLEDAGSVCSGMWYSQCTYIHTYIHTYSYIPKILKSVGSNTGKPLIDSNFPWKKEAIWLFEVGTLEQLTNLEFEETIALFCLDEYGLTKTIQINTFGRTHQEMGICIFL